MHQIGEVGTIINLILQLGKLRHHEVKCHAQGHATSNWKSQELNPGNQVLDTAVLLIVLSDFSKD